ncbi:MAG: glutamate mutase L [Candidatus Aminicenantes bacterium]|nr:glutamate mutase L [Candidatus Aminicenantes bacterium]
MTPPAFASVDIGSTYTKGALFALEAGAFRLLARAETPTTVDDLAEGFARVRKQLAAGSGSSTDVPVYLSSSARGGLKIAALGLTADLTLSIARMAAYSAGGKVVRTYAYELSAEEIADLERLRPDIVLFTGGTDGGNSAVVLKNAELLGRSTTDAFILYAGNRKVRDRVLALLDKKAVAAADNVMPEVGTIQIEPAREVIRKIFLERIVDGKGLSAVVREIGRDPWPTPLAVFELAGKIGATQPGWSDFGMIDMGGATTDFYSHTEAFTGGDSVLLRGLHEPLLKRTVEGDLGMRVSAEALWESERTLITSRLAALGRPVEAFDGYIRAVAAAPESRPENPTEEEFDALMAAACVRAAALRHAGTLSKVYTPQGGFYVQRGKDLRRLTRLIGTGGYLSRSTSAGPVLEACAPQSADVDSQPLLPVSPEAYADEGYLIPLTANLAGDFPEEAARTAVAGLRKLKG